MPFVTIGTLPSAVQAEALGQEVSARFDILRTLLIFGLVWLHVPPHIDIPTDVFPATALTFSQLLIGNVLFRATLPCLSVISGYLLFFHYTQKSYSQIVWRKTRNLLVPLLLWNLVLLIPYTLLSRYGLIHLPERMEYMTEGWAGYVDALIGLTDVPLNQPTVFLRDMFVCILLLPVLAWFLKQAPWAGLLIAALITFFIGSNWVMFRPEIMFYMYCGGLWVTHGKVMWLIIDRLAWELVGLAILMTIGMTWYAYGIIAQHEPMEPVAFGPLMNGFKPFAVIGFFALSGLLWRLSWGASLAKGAKWSFFVFCCHSPIQVFAWFFLQKKLPHASTLAQALYFILAPFVTVVLCMLAYKTLDQMSPKLLGVLTGGRKAR